MIQTDLKSFPNRWLILSHAFNMDGRAASQTVTDKLPHLISRGITPVVLSGVLGERDSLVKHHRLLPAGPAALRFDLRFVLRRLVGNSFFYRFGTASLSLIFIPFVLLEKLLFGRQSQWSWAISAYFFGLWAIRHYQLSCIYASGGAYSAQLAGLWLKRKTGLPLLVEIHDPLVFRGARDVRLSTRDSIYQEQLEGWIAREADLAWWFTQGALDTAIFRHRELRKNGICVLPGANPPLLNARYQRGTKLVIGHFGSLSKTRSLNRFVQGLQLAIEHCPELRNVFELHIYGGDLDELSKRDLDRYQLQDQVKIWGRLEFDEATQLTGREQVMQRMQQVDVLLMAHGEIDNCAEYIPSKLYEYFWANRPVFGLTHLNQQINDMILDRGGYCAPAIDTSQISNTLIQIYDDWIAALPKGPYGESSNSWHPKLPPVGVGEGISQILSAMRERGIHTVPSS